MNTSSRLVATAAALLAFSAVILAAMGSHLIEMNGLQSIWQTASVIHLFSASALVGLAALLAWRDSSILRWGTWMICLGTIIFCGSIYMRVITGFDLGQVTPFGGMLMMAGWLLTALGFFKKS